jgi:hypothetical protein
VAAGEADLKRVLPDQRHVLEVQVLFRQLIGGIEAAGNSALAAAAGAGAGPAQALAVIGRKGAVIPRDAEGIRGTVEVDRGRKRVVSGR